MFALFVLLAGPFRLHAGLSLTATPGADDFVLFDGTHAAALVVGTNEDRAVLRAAGDWVADVQRVTGVQPQLYHEAPAGEKVVVIAGTLGRSRLLDQLAAAGKLDLTGLAGQWESTVWQIVKAPLPGVDSALVIAGSDRRGTIFGIYEVSKTIGVSPWHWWADVPVAHQDRLALRGGLFKQGPPAVKYRGIFLNDEDFCLRPWAAKTFARRLSRKRKTSARKPTRRSLNCCCGCGPIISGPRCTPARRPSTPIPTTRIWRTVMGS
jgi:hypothetical protein